MGKSYALSHFNANVGLQGTFRSEIIHRDHALYKSLSARSGRLLGVVFIQKLLRLADVLKLKKLLASSA